MIELSRRKFIFGAAATIAIIRTPGLIMPVKAFEDSPMTSAEVYLEMRQQFEERWSELKYFDPEGFKKYNGFNIFHGRA